MDKNVTPKQIANYIINKKIDINDVLPVKLIEEILSISKVEEVSEEELRKIIKEVLTKNPKISEDYKNGHENVLQFIIGQVMYNVKKKIDTKALRNLILEELK
ncbi:MAG: Aspartyl/glutamyl-tRNA(Asn/Gln) amidotransferase subunit B [Candidatus Levybacteria bacterium GW2011_GWB1_35_5]|nr:MAG: Aspartyl/glutamyl-tRNA(Asn/Gln) amidotransferase subunit B [Candidatus Levybacteria bacterium GW2011_GWB1_35_5]